MEFLEYYKRLNEGFENIYKQNLKNHILYSTDKQNHHDYIVSFYDQELSNKKDLQLNILEIGVLTGNSLRVWKNWFTNSKIYGVDNWSDTAVKLVLEDLDGVNLVTGNAYDINFLDNFEDNFFDYIIDDGPHNIDSQIFTVQKWISKVKNGGKIIIEDVKDIEVATALEKTILNNSEVLSYKIHDFRYNKNRFLYDDILIEIIKK